MKYRMASKSFTPPSTEEFFKEKYWAINEAAHVLTGWPKVGLHLLPLKLSGEAAQHRSFFYLPYPYSQFDSKTFGTGFNDVFLQLREAINKGFLRAIFEHLDDAIICLVSPEELVLWAVKNGLSLPDDLQKAAGLHQTDDQTVKDSMLRKVQRKIVAQFILGRHPDANETDLCKHDLMQRLGGLDKSGDPDLKVVKRAIGELYKTPGCSGRPPKFIQRRQKRPYFPEPISEVLRRAPDGTVRYHFPYLKKALETVARAKILVNDDTNLGKKLIGEGALEFLQDPVAKLYLPAPAPLLLQFAQQSVFQGIGDELFPLDALYKAIASAEAAGLQFEWPLKMPQFPQCEIRRSEKICLF